MGDALTILMAAGGTLLVWAGFTGRNPWAVITAALRGEPTPAKAASVVATIPAPDASTGTGTADAGAPGYTPPSGPGSARVGTSDLPAPPNGQRRDPATLDLVLIGQGSHKLNRRAAAAFSSAERNYGGAIKVTDSYRSYEQQAACHKAKPNLCAAPGRSMHELGLAVDVVDAGNSRIVDAMTRAGWQRARADEPWHYSFGYRG